MTHRKCMAYNLDFRKQVLDYLKSGRAIKGIIFFFSISRNSMKSWISLSKKRNVIINKQKECYIHQRLDLEDIIVFLESNPEATLKDIVQALIIDQRTSR